MTLKTKPTKLPAWASWKLNIKISKRLQLFYSFKLYNCYNICSFTYNHSCYVITIVDLHLSLSSLLCIVIAHVDDVLSIWAIVDLLYSAIELHSSVYNITKHSVKQNLHFYNLKILTLIKLKIKFLIIS